MKRILFFLLLAILLISAFPEKMLAGDLSITLPESIIQNQGFTVNISNATKDNCYGVFIYNNFNEFILNNERVINNNLCTVDDSVYIDFGGIGKINHVKNKTFFSATAPDQNYTIALPAIQKTGNYHLKVAEFANNCHLLKIRCGTTYTKEIREKTIDFTVQPNKTAPIITLDQPSEAVSSNQTISLSGKLTDSEKNPISEATINFSFSYNNILKNYDGSAATNNDGIYTLSIPPNAFSIQEGKIFGFTITPNTDQKQDFKVTAAYHKKDGTVVEASRELNITILAPKSSQSPVFPPCEIYENLDGTPIPNDNNSLMSAGVIKCAKADTAIGGIATDPAGFIQKLFAVLLSLSGGVIVFILILSGYKLMTSAGNPEKVKEAQESITSAVIGLLFVIFALVILQTLSVDIFHIPGFNP